MNHLHWAVSSAGVTQSSTSKRAGQFMETRIWFNICYMKNRMTFLSTFYRNLEFVPFSVTNLAEL